MTDFKSINTNDFCSPLVVAGSKRGSLKSLAQKRCPYWDEWRGPRSAIDAYSLIDSVDLNDTNVIVTHGEQVDLFEVDEDFTKMTTLKLGAKKKARRAYGGRFRKTDKQLICVGCQDGGIRVFRSKGSSQMPMRTMRAGDIKFPVHCCDFASVNNHVYGGFDDGSFCCFDLGSEDLELKLSVHEDHLRSIYVDADSSLLMTGSHDCTAVLMDSRMFGEDAGVVHRFQHGTDAVETVELCNHMAMVSAGRHTLVYDLRQRSVPLYDLGNHQNTVLSIHCVLANDTNFLMAGGLDGLLQIYAISNGSHVHSMNVGSAITSIKCCMSIGKMLLGCGDGEVRQIEHRPPVIHVDSNSPGFTKLRRFEVLLKKFECTEALRTSVTSQSHQDAVDCINALIDRDQLKTALIGQDGDKVFRLLASQLDQNPGNADIIISACLVAIESYREGHLDVSDGAFMKLAECVEAEFTLQNDLMKIQGLYSVFKSQKTT